MITNPALTSLTLGVPDIAYVIVEGNASLASIDGLSGNIAGLHISDNAVLDLSFDGLEANQVLVSEEPVARIAISDSTIGQLDVSNLADVDAFVVSGTSSIDQLSIKNCPKLAVSPIQQEDFIHCGNLDDEPCAP